MLNAWRRHWLGQHGEPGQEQLWRCAQRLAASLAGAVDQGIDTLLNGLECSTPGGVIGWGSRLGGVFGIVGGMCFTPGGVIGWGRAAASLSASDLRLCSTPGGVIGWGSKGDYIIVSADSWCSTPGGVIGWGRPVVLTILPAPISAQRLAASLAGAASSLR